MFPSRYFARRFWPARHWPRGLAALAAAARRVRRWLPAPPPRRPRPWGGR